MSHSDYKDLLQSIEVAKEKVQIRRKYFHYKNPDKYYLVIYIFLLESDQQVLVIYQPLYMNEKLLWARKLEGEGGWLNEITLENGYKVHRFTEVHA